MGRQRQTQRLLWGHGAGRLPRTDHQLGRSAPAGPSPPWSDATPTSSTSSRENRRQHDVAERQALAELRDGDVGKAVAWYHDQGRSAPWQSATDALQRAVDAWAADVAAGHQTGLYAWRRANVAALNHEPAPGWKPPGGCRDRN